jgi:hypothetical protein
VQLSEAWGEAKTRLRPAERRHGGLDVGLLIYPLVWRVNKSLLLLKTILEKRSLRL